MPDLLVRLYDLPSAENERGPSGDDWVVRRAMAYEKAVLTRWVNAHFGEGWASECEVAFANHPISVHIASIHGEISGFACYDSVCRGFFGPIGVDDQHRRQGIGRALTLACLNQMRDLGYGYAIIGGVTDADFYARVVDAMPIPGSSPGIYTHRLRS